jgi:hypothetical protein
MTIRHKRRSTGNETSRFQNSRRAWNDNHQINTDDDNIMFTPEGGLAIKLVNGTGAPSVKGNCVTPSAVADGAVTLVPVDVPNCIGVFYDSDITDGEEAWIVISGIADVYFWTSTTRGQLARTGLTADTGEVAGQAYAENFPAAPFLVDKHFCEIGHVLESRTGAGLARVALHFN